MTTDVFQFLQLWANNTLYVYSRMPLLQDLTLQSIKQLQLSSSFVSQSVTHCIVRTNFQCKAA